MKTPEKLAKMAREFADRELQSHPMYINGLYDGYIAGYKAAAPHWFSLQEVLPELNQEVLVRDVNGESYLATVTKSGIQIKSSGCSRCDEPIDVVFWREISEPSKWKRVNFKPG